LAEYVRSNTPLERPVVIGPDEESEQWALAAAKAIGADHDVLQKKRLTAEKVQILTTRSLPVRGRDVLLIDDIISTGDTIVSASKMLKEQGARRVIIACTHPILAHDALARIYATGAEIVVGTDTVPSPISHVSVAPLIADALMRYSRSFPTLLEYVADGRS
jgi:ribose-phosphate pyrophosphokinase